MSGPDSTGVPTPTSSRRPLLVSVVILATIVVALLAALLTRPAAAPPEPPASPAVPSLPDVPVATDSPAAAWPVFLVPTSIDPTGVEDVTEDLQDFVDALPDGAILRMQPDATYRVEGTIFVNGATGLDWDGAGATIQATESVDFNRRNISLVETSFVHIHDLTIRGAHPEPGTLDREKQFEHGIWIDSGSDIEISDVTIENPIGDCIYVGVGDEGLPWVERLSIHDIVCRGAGRNGVAIVGGSAIRIEQSTFENIGLHVVNIEPNRSDGADGSPATRVQGGRDVAMIGNRIIGPVDGYIFAANGWGAIDNLSVIDNVVEGAPLRITVQPLPGSGFIRTGILVTGNRSDTPYETIDGAAMRFTRALDLTVRDNVGPLSGGLGALIEIKDSCRVDIGGNTFPGGTIEVLGEAGPCPEATAPTTP